MSIWSLTYQQSVFRRFHSNEHYKSFTHKMAAKTSWHRCGTKLRQFALCIQAYCCPRPCHDRARRPVEMRAGVVISAAASDKDPEAVRRPAGRDQSWASAHLHHVRAISGGARSHPFVFTLARRWQWEDEIAPPPPLPPQRPPSPPQPINQSINQDFNSSWQTATRQSKMNTKWMINNNNNLNINM